VRNWNKSIPERLPIRELYSDSLATFRKQGLEALQHLGYHFVGDGADRRRFARPPI